MGLGGDLVTADDGVHRIGQASHLHRDTVGRQVGDERPGQHEGERPGGEHRRHRAALGPGGPHQVEQATEHQLLADPEMRRDHVHVLRPQLDARLAPLAAQVTDEDQVAAQQRVGTARGERRRAIARRQAVPVDDQGFPAE
jgi:hypothetical protein